MIVVNMFGGLGNQMFQYALGRRLAHDCDAQLRFDVAAMQNDPLREFALHGFRIAGFIAEASDIPWHCRIFSRASRVFAMIPLRPRYIRENGFTFDKSVFRAGGSAYVDGYWQSERYFVDIADVIRADFALAAPISATRKGIAERIACPDRTSISLHVRRGDYVSNPIANAYHGTCSPDWYAAAMAHVVEGIEMPTFFVFSDDPDWARANLPDRWPREFVEPQADGRDFEDMHLMAACRHHITANSSFSWWGAWLDPRPDKRVIAPREWFHGAGLDTRDLIPPSWVTM